MVSGQNRTHPGRVLLGVAGSVSRILGRLVTGPVSVQGTAAPPFAPMLRHGKRLRVPGSPNPEPSNRRILAYLPMALSASRHFLTATSGVNASLSYSTMYHWVLPVVSQRWKTSRHGMLSSPISGL